LNAPPVTYEVTILALNYAGKLSTSYFVNIAMDSLAKVHHWTY